MLSKPQTYFIKLKCKNRHFWVKVGAQVLTNYLQFKLHDSPMNELAINFAAQQLSFEIYSTLNKVIGPLTLCALEENINSPNVTFEFPVELKLDSLYGNHIHLITDSIQIKENLLEKFNYSHHCIQLPKFIKASGSKKAKLASPFNEAYQLELYDGLYSGDCKIYLQIEIRIYNQLQKLFVSRCLIKYICNKINPHETMSFNEYYTNLAVNHIEKYLNHLLDVKCDVRKWNYCKLDKPSSYYHFNFTTKSVQSRILTRSILPFIQDILYKLLKQKDQQSKQLGIEHKVIHSPVIVAESRLNMDEISQLEPGDVLICTQSTLKIELGPTAILFEEIESDKTKLLITGVLIDE